MFSSTNFMKTYTSSMLLLCLLAFAACDEIKSSTKATISKSGEAVGKTATEFVAGVGNGIDKSLALNIVLSPELEQKGLAPGTYSLGKGTGENKNILTLYLIFNQPFADTLTVKAFDKEGLEIGRSKIFVKGQADEAAYYDVPFDTRTNFESKGKVLLEQKKSL